jgi:REP element-mobilizing transposase RayT
MARRRRLFAPGLLYHVIVRGNQRQNTFLADEDYQAYLRRLGRYRDKYSYSVHAYCLMPNHVHLLIETSEHPLAKFMQGLQQSYTQYFNLKYHKTGHVFQGRYKAIICDKDEYLLELLRYVHLNPVRAGMLKSADGYRYSGHQAYLQSKRTEIIDPQKVLAILGGPKAYRRFISDGLNQGHKEEYYELEDQRFLGADGFGEKVLQKTEKVQRTAKRRSIEAVSKELGREFGYATEELRSPNRSWAISKARTMIAYVLVRNLGYSLGEVAAYVGRDIASIGALIGRLENRMRSDKQMFAKVERLTQKVKI